MTYDITDIDIFSNPRISHISTANGDIARVKQAGNLKLTPTIDISHCLYIPSLTCKLLSISQLTKELNCVVSLYPRFCIIQDILTQRILGRGIEKDGLYYVSDISTSGTALQTKRPSLSWFLHRRLGHPSSGYFKRLFPKLPLPAHCDTCVLAKSHRNHFPLSASKSKNIFELVHSDVWGPAPIGLRNSFTYFLLFIDDHTRMTWIYFLKSKSEVPSKFEMFYKMVSTQYQKTIQILRSDNGGEFVNQAMQRFFQNNGLIHQTSCPNTPQQNGVAERKNRIILEITRALLLESQVPTFFWPEAVATAVHLLNRLPTKVLDFKTPLDTFNKNITQSPLQTISPKIFGCSVFVHIPKSNRSKFDPCALKCVFIGYGVHQKGYRCYHPPTRRIFTTMDCDFVETEYFYKSRAQGEKQKTDSLDFSTNDLYLSREPILPIAQPQESSSGSPIEEGNIVSTTSNNVSAATEKSIDLPATNSHMQEVVENTGTYNLPRRQNRGVPPRRYSPEHLPRNSRYPVSNIVKGKMTKEAKSYMTKLYSEKLPRNIQEAQGIKEWQQAMETEMAALEKNETWEKCLLPKNKRPVGCRWVFTIKHKADGSVERYKARLVAKGYTQTYGLDYSETFSPVAKIDTIRILFSIAANMEWPLHQFDVKNAFLHGELKEEVYMEAPPGFTKNFGRNEVCKLKKALYGLKQSPRAWFGRFTIAMKKYGYRQSHSDHTLFLKRRGKLITCLIIYVDDMIITGDDADEISCLKANLFKEFEMKDLGGLKYFLGIEVLRSKEGIFISQRKYILDILAEAGMMDCKPAETPIIVNHGLKIEKETSTCDQGKYQRLVGKLIYLGHTRPDIAYAVGIVSQFMHKPQTAHMEAALRILRYLKGTYDHGVFFRNNNINFDVQGYTDADWAGNQVDRRSTSRYFTLVGGNLVTWKSKKQKVVALSSAEAEFRGMSKGIAELIWIRKLLSELGINQERPYALMCDNKSAICISENPVQHDRTKHIEVDRHFIKEKLEDGTISLPYIKSEDQLADILTKAVNGRIFHGVLRKLGIGNPTAELEGECENKE